MNMNYCIEEMDMSLVTNYFFALYRIFQQLYKKIDMSLTFKALRSM